MVGRATCFCIAGTLGGSLLGLACGDPTMPADDGGDPSVKGRVDCADYASGPTVGPGAPGPTGFPESFCDPRASGEGLYKCCSDDPAAAEGSLPDYVQKGVAQGGVPYFSGVNNAQGTSGMCVRTGDIPTGSGLLEPAAANCPVPCNPTWDRESIDVVCGASQVCCQTRPLQASDCVQDPESGELRPVSGADIGQLTDWAGEAHATHQDPGGVGCQEAAIAAGASPSDAQTHPVFRDCMAQLSVADQRGFCMALGAGHVCPTEASSYVSACDAG